MKIISFWIAVTVLLTPELTLAQDKSFTVTVKITNFKNPSLLYLKYSDDGKNILDSVKSSDGSFTFRGKVSEPQKALLFLDHEVQSTGQKKKFGDYQWMYLENAAINVVSTDSVKNGIVSGSSLNNDNAAYKKFISPYTSKINALNAEYAAVNSGKIKIDDRQKFLNDFEPRFAKAEKEKEEHLYQWIKIHPDSYTGLFLLIESTTMGLDVSRVEPVFNALSPNIRSGKNGQEFLKKMDVYRSISVGSVAPDFTMNDVNDVTITLSSLRGKYVLVDFWASWCGPCRAENPNLVKAYNKYKNKNFTVLGVSLDQPGKKEAWLEAIQKDGLTWTHVSDLKFCDNAAAKLYKVTSVPHNLLLDPQGKIVAKDLRGEALESKLEEIINKKQQVL